MHTPLLTLLLFFFSIIIPAQSSIGADPFLAEAYYGWVVVHCYDCGFADPNLTDGFVVYRLIGQDDQILRLRYAGDACDPDLSCYGIWYSWWIPPDPGQYEFLSGQINDASIIKVISGLPAAVYVHNRLWLPVIQSP